MMLSWWRRWLHKQRWRHRLRPPRVRVGGITLGLVLAMATPASAAIDGISDDNLPLMTERGRAALEFVHFRHARMVISMGTPASNPQVRAWMRESRRHSWTVTVSARRTAGQPIPTARAYSNWLRGILRTYPAIGAVEATNEPELTHVPVLRAVALYRAARRVAPGRVTVLAGGFSDVPGTDRYVRSYVRRVRSRVYALHSYISVIENKLARVRATIRLTGAREIWITETAAFVAHGSRTFTRAQQLRQAGRVVRMSNWPEVTRTYWQGWEACHGCQPVITQPVASNLPGAGPILPYRQPTSTIVWDPYLLSSTGDETSTRPSALLLAG